EGQLVAYLTWSAAENQKVVDAFKKKYSGVNVEFVSGQTNDVRDRVTTEFRAGKTLSDVFASTDTSVEPLTSGGMALEYVPSEILAYPSELRDPKNMYYTVA